HLPFVRAGGADGLDQVRHQLRAPDQLHINAGPGGGDLVAQPDQAVVGDRDRHREQHDQQGQGPEEDHHGDASAHADRAAPAVASQRSSTAAAAPESIASAARSTPTRSTLCRSGSSSPVVAAVWAANAAAALTSTASRTGPGSPASSRRVTSALVGGSPPRSAPGADRAMPSSAASTTVSRTLPPTAAQIRVRAAVVSSSKPSS